MLGLSSFLRATSAPRAPRAAATTLIAAAWAVLALAAAAPASAQDRVRADIYVGSLVDEAKPIAVFAFDDPDASGFQAIDALAIYAEPDYTPEANRYDPREGCRFTGQFQGQLDQVALQPAPIYGPNSGRDAVAFPDLPAFFAQQVMRVMVERGEIDPNSPQFAYYTSCISFVWAQQLSQPEEVWREILEELLPR